MYDKRKGIRKSEEEKKCDCVHPRARLAGTGDISRHITTQIPQISQSIWCKLILSRHNSEQSPGRQNRSQHSGLIQGWGHHILLLALFHICEDWRQEKIIQDFFLSNQYSNNDTLTPVVAQYAVGTLGRFIQNDDHHAYIFSKFTLWRSNIF